MRKTRIKNATMSGRTNIHKNKAKFCCTKEAVEYAKQSEDDARLRLGVPIIAFPLPRLGLCTLNRAMLS